MADVWTSSSHPLILAQLAGLPAPWSVAITIAPGKCGPARGPYIWKRDLETDLEAVSAAGIGTLVCLLEAQELEQWEIPDLIPAARKRGIEVLHLPIKDVSEPTLEEARALVRQLLERAASPILIHCVGGLGRSGLIAGCLLRAMGLGYAETLEKLVAARGPECPQSSDQRDFVKRFTIAGI